MEDYYDLLLRDELQLWVAVDKREILAAAITTLEQGSNAKICSILSLAGKNIKDWIGALNAEITKFAEDNHCTAIEAVTRRGFSRFVPEFIEDGVVYIKIIGDTK